MTQDTPAQREAKMVQAYRLTVGAARMSASLGWDAAEPLSAAAVDMALTIAAHRAEHGQQTPDRAVVL